MRAGWSLAAVGATLVVAATARAQVEAIRIAYHSGPGCPDEARFVGEVMGRTDRARRASGSEPGRTFDVSLTGEGSRSRGVLRITDAGGRVTKRDVAGETCTEVAGALALVAALAIDPQARTGTDPAVHAPAAPPPPPPPPAVAVGPDRTGNDGSPSEIVPDRFSSPAQATVAPAPLAPLAVPAPANPLVAPEPEAPVVAPTAAPLQTAKPLRPAPAPAATTAPPSPPTTLAAEVSSLDAVRRSLAAGDAASARALLDRYDRQFARPSLGPESALLRLEVLLGLGRNDEARRLGERLLAEEPDSAYEQRVRSLLGQAASPSNP